VQERTDHEHVHDAWLQLLHRRRPLAHVRPVRLHRPARPTSKKDNYWCPTTRKYALSGTNGPPDYVGVYVVGVHHNLVGLFGASFTFSNDTVIRIEPRALR
jgi:hypothetical protein